MSLGRMCCDCLGLRIQANGISSILSFVIIIKTLTFKTRLSADPFLCKWVLLARVSDQKLCISLALKQRFVETRKWPICTVSNNIHILTHPERSDTKQAVFSRLENLSHCCLNQSLPSHLEPGQRVTNRWASKYKFIYGAGVVSGLKAKLWF